MIPLRLQVGYFVDVNHFEWPAQPTPAAAHRAESHLLQKVIDNLRPTAKTSACELTVTETPQQLSWRQENSLPKSDYARVAFG